MSNINPNDPNDPDNRPVDLTNQNNPIDPNAPLNNVERAGYAQTIAILGVIIVAMFIILVLFNYVRTPAPAPTAVVPVNSTVTTVPGTTVTTTPGTVTTVPATVTTTPTTTITTTPATQGNSTP